ADLVWRAEHRVRPLPQWRLRAGRLATGTAIGFVGFVAAFANDASYPLLARALDLKPLSTVSTPYREVGLIVEAPADSTLAVASAIQRHGGSASFAVTDAPSGPTQDVLHSFGDETLPTLQGSGAVRWLGTKKQLGQVRKRLG